MNRGTYLSLGDTGRPEDRVVRIVNLHYEADSEDVCDFFGEDFTVIDFIRGVNSKTSKNTVGYVLLATEQERIDAQALSGHRILDRKVKILHAHGGFRISSSGDRLLSPSKDKHTWVSNVEEPRDEAPLAIGDVDAFPSLTTAVTPRLTDRTPITAPLRKRPAQQRALQDRLLFLNNVGQGPEVNETSFRLYFGDYVVVDVKRLLDPFTCRPNPTAFVMFASTEDRDAALHHLRGVPMQGRNVSLEVPKTFQNGNLFPLFIVHKLHQVMFASIMRDDGLLPAILTVHLVDEQGFLPSSNANIITLSTFPRSSVADSLTLAPFNTRTGLHEGVPIIPFSTSSSIANDAPNEFQYLLDQFETVKTEFNRAQNSQAIRSLDVERWAKNSEVTWGMRREELHRRYLGQQRTLALMPSGVEGPGQVVTGPPMTPPAVIQSSSARTYRTVPNRPPPGIITTFKPSEYRWGLGSNHSPAHHVISEEAWYGGKQALQKRKDDIKRAKPNTFQYIIARGSIGEEELRDYK